jgi:hypothetical protein
VNEKELDDLIDRWHNGEGRDEALHEFLGMTWEEMDRWIRTSELPEDKDNESRK